MAPRLPGKWKGRVKRNESESERRDAIEKAQKTANARMLAQLAAKKELERKRRLLESGKGKGDKVDPMKAARMLAGNKAETMYKLVWSAWRIGVKMSQQEKALMKRERQWRRMCTRDPTGQAGGCGAWCALKDPTYQLPCGADFLGKGNHPNLRQTSETLLAATRMGLRSAEPNPYLLHNTSGLGATFPAEPSSPERAQTAPSKMNLSRSLPSLAATLAGRTASTENTTSLGATLAGKEGGTRLHQHGKWEEVPKTGWEEATRWSTGQKCWYHHALGRVSYIDPVRHHEEKVVQLGEAAGHSRHYTEAAHMQAEHRSEYLEAQKSIHFRSLNAKKPVTRLDLGESNLRRY